jgi:phosphoserine phosphatase
MKSDPIFDRQMVVLELDGAVVHDHTPSELIRAGFPLRPHRYEQAFDLYQREITGNVKPEEAILQYATLARGLTLRRAIEYATFKMRFINGFDTFIEILYQKNVSLLLVSSSFSIITEAIRWLYGPDRFQAVLANSLAFGLEKNPEAVNYVCSSFKDRETLLTVARSGGRVIAFNFEESLEIVIQECQENNHAEDKIDRTTPKSRRANLRSVFETLFPDG